MEYAGIYYVITSIVAFSLFLGTLSVIRKESDRVTKKDEDLTKGEKLSEEDKKTFNSLPSINNFEYVQLEEIDTTLQLKKDEVALMSLNIKSMNISKKIREIGGGSGSFYLLGASFGMSKRRVSKTTEYEELKVNRTIFTNKRLYVDTDQTMFTGRLSSILLVEYHEGLTLRMVTGEYHNASIYLNFKTKKDMKMFMRIYLTQGSLGTIYGEEEK